jgi:hypothetical protein
LEAVFSCKRIVAHKPPPFDARQPAFIVTVILTQIQQHWVGRFHGWIVGFAQEGKAALPFGASQK